MTNTTRGNPIFAVRLPRELQDGIRAAAQREGLGVSQWLDRVLRPAVEADPSPSVAVRLKELEARVAALEGAGSGKPITPRPAAAQRAKVATPKARIAPSPEKGQDQSGRNPEWFHQPKGAKLNDAGKAEIFRRFEAGEADPSIAKVMGMTKQGINKLRQIWKGTKHEEESSN